MEGNGTRSERAEDYNTALTPAMKCRGGQIVSDLFDVGPNSGEDYAEYIFTEMLSARTKDE
jgi:hypothetical protein